MNIHISTNFVANTNYVFCNKYACQLPWPLMYYNNVQCLVYCSNQSCGLEMCTLISYTQQYQLPTVTDTLVNERLLKLKNVIVFITTRL